MGSCVIIRKNGFTIMFDCAYVNQESQLRTYLTLNNVTHIDVLMISHFHSDHAGCQQMILEDYCDENTRIYIGMIPDYDLFTRDESASELRYEQFVALCDQLNYTYEVPTNNSTITINGVDFRFLNTDTNYLTDYYSSYSDTNINDYQTSTANNVSLVCEITINGSKILLTGDVEQVAQTKIKDYIEQVDLMQIPHHNYNMYGDFEFFNNANPTLAFANRGTTAQSFFPYFSRYCKFIKNIRLIQNLEVDILIKGKYNHLIVDKGVDFLTGYDDPSRYQLLTYLPSPKYCRFANVDLYDFSLWDSAYIFNLYENYSDRLGLSIPFVKGGRYTALQTELEKMDAESSHTQYTLLLNFKYMDFVYNPYLFATFRIYKGNWNDKQKYQIMIPNSYANVELTGDAIKNENVYYRQNFVATVSDDDTQNTYEVPVYKVNSTLNNQRYLGYWQNLSAGRYFTFMKVEITITSNGYTMNYYRVVYDITANSWTVYNTNPQLVKIKI